MFYSSLSKEQILHNPRKLYQAKITHSFVLGIICILSLYLKYEEMTCECVWDTLSVIFSLRDKQTSDPELSQV